MKPRTLARLALQWIDDNSFSFDTEERKVEAIKQLKRIINGKTTEINNPIDPLDPITELHIGIIVPNFDYPLIPINSWGEPIIWKEDNNYKIPGKGTHILKGISLNGETYLMKNIYNMCPYKNAIIKVDKYTDLKRAAWVFACNCCEILNKKENVKKDGLYGLKYEYEVLKTKFEEQINVKTYEKMQKNLYIKWLSKFINEYQKNPCTHMRLLKLKNFVKT